MQVAFEPVLLDTQITSVQKQLTFLLEWYAQGSVVGSLGQNTFIWNAEQSFWFVYIFV